MASTVSVSRGVRPRCSISARKTSGNSSPRSGCCQRTSASTPTTSPRRGVALGLVVQDELAALERAVEVLAGLQALAAVAVELGGVALGAGAAALGLVHGDVGVAQQRGSSPPTAIPMLALMRSVIPATSSGSPMRSSSRCGDEVGVGARGQHERELVAAEAREQVASGRRAAASRRAISLQQLVADVRGRARR